MNFNKQDIADLPKIKRLNLINSVTGIKPGNLIGTKSNDGQSNLAVISSVVHLGSNPPYLGFILRPSGFVRRDTYDNILENKQYTINHIPLEKTAQAHYTSAKFDQDISEFDECNFTEEYLNDFLAPFVAESKVKIGLQYLESIPIQVNNTVMIIGEILSIDIQGEAINKEGYLNLEILESAGIGGLNSYYKLIKMDEHPYARVEDLPNFKQ
jgi:flavin reductase (DIM6/NTAB) family NADH-FMN oxidoreductase RutF